MFNRRCLKDSVKIIKMYQWARSKETRPNKLVFCRDLSFIAKLSLLLQCFLIVTLLLFNSLSVAFSPFIRHSITEEPVSRKIYMLKRHQVIPDGQMKSILKKMMERLASKDITLHQKQKKKTKQKTKKKNIKSLNYVFEHVIF